MTTKNKAREAWKQAVKDHGTHSPEEIAAYQVYMSARQGKATGVKSKRQFKAHFENAIDHAPVGNTGIKITTEAPNVMVVWAEKDEPKIKQADLPELSEAKTYELCNPVTEISRPLARQERFETLNLF